MLPKLEDKQQNVDNIKDPRWFAKRTIIALKPEAISRGAY